MSFFRIMGVSAAATFAIVMAVAASMYFGLIPVPGPLIAFLAGGKPPEHTARYYPPETQAYAWATLAPGEEQLADMRDIWSRLEEYPAFGEIVEELKTDFLEETSIDFDEDVMPWIGPEVTAGLMSIDTRRDEPSATIMIGVRDQDKAADFLRKWLEYTKDSAGAEFEAGTHHGIDVWVDEARQQTYALTRDWLVFATAEELLKDTLSRLDGNGGESLADNENFKAARGALPERRFISVYVDYQQSQDLLGEMFPGNIGPVPDSLFPLTSSASRKTEWIAGSVGWMERGVTLEFVAPGVTGLELDRIEAQDPSNLLPVDTLGFIAAGFDPDVDNWRATLREHRLDDLMPEAGLFDEINAGAADMASNEPPELSPDATLAEILDLGIWLVEDQTGINMETGLFNHLEGQFVLAVREFDFNATAADPAATPVEAVAMLSYRQNRVEELSDTMDKVASLLQENVGLIAHPADMGSDHDAIVFDAGLIGMTMGTYVGYRPGYVLHDQYLTIGTTEQALATTVERQKGKGENLSSDIEYGRAVENLPEGRQVMGYVNLSSIMNQLEPDDLGIEPDRYQVLSEGLGVLAFGSALGETHGRGMMVLTLFPN